MPTSFWRATTRRGVRAVSDREQLPPELRHRVEDLRSTLRRIVDDLERLEEEAEDLEERVGGPIVDDGPYISGIASEALASLAVGVEALEEGGDQG